jgi:Fe-Mn family superoxide dismutase
LEKKFYSIPPLGYSYNALEPHISEEQLKIHHSKHHQAYVDNANAILKKLDDAAQGGTDVDVKGLSKETLVQLGRHELGSF